MATTEQILKREFDLIVVDLKTKHVELGMKASGKWLDELEVSTTSTSAKVIGEHYTRQLVQGRKPGTFPPIDAIRQWIVDKGIVSNIRGNITVSSLAFLIARKIAESGTRYFQQGGTDLVDSVVTPKRMQTIIDMVGHEAAINLASKLENEFKKIAV